MPILNWTEKHLSPPAPAAVILDSVLYPKGRGYPKARPDGRIILGDNLPVMAALLPEYEGRINLIYADPPFFTNRKFPARIGRGRIRANRLSGNWPKAITTTGMILIPIWIFSINASLDVSPACPKRHTLPPPRLACGCLRPPPAR
jgi:hypothetical protein